MAAIPAPASKLTATRVVWIATPVVLLALWPSVTTLVQFWLRIRDYQYGLVVGAACLVWLYVAARGLGARPAQPRPWTLPVLFLATLAWTIAYLGASDTTHQILLPLVLWLVVVAGAGGAAGAATAEPIACLYLGMPLWDYLLPALQRTTVVVTEGLLHLLGIPATVMASTVQIPEGSFQIAEGCAGKKYFMVAVTIGVLAGAYSRLSVRGRLLLIGAAAALALCTNWLRVITVVVAGHLTHMQHYLVAKEHLTFGTVLFGFLVLVLGLILRLLARKMPAHSAPETPLAEDSATRRHYVALAAATVVPLVLPLGSSLVGNSTAEVRLAGLPVQTSDWQGPLPPDSSWQPRFAGAADEARAAYIWQNRRIEVYVNVYGPQEDGKELINYDNALLAPGEWEVATAPSMSRRDAPDLALPVLAIETGVSRTGRWTVGYLYTTGGYAVHSDLGVQLTYGALALTGHPATGIAAVATRCAEDCKATRRLLEDFWLRHGGEVLALIPGRYAAH